MQEVTQQSALSRRQAEIANLVVAGKSSREIAETLSLSPRTVEHHLEAIFNKLGVGSRVELVAALLRPRPPEPGHPAVAPLRSVDAIPNNLPRKLTSFIGREAEIAEITTLIESHQLVTLVGSGGVGKTRTSLAVAEKVFDAFSDGVWFVELAPLSRGDYIPGAVAQGLGLTLAADGDPVAKGDLDRSARLAGYVDASATRIGYSRSYMLQTLYDRLMTRLHEQLAPGELARLTTEGASLTPEATIDLAPRGTPGHRQRNRSVRTTTRATYSY